MSGEHTVLARLAACRLDGLGARCFRFRWMPMGRRGWDAGAGEWFERREGGVR